MAQQASPWLEGAYGWNFGEDGWNTGMDQNLLKFSFMFDRNVDSIVASLPSAVNGQAHYNTADNRIYFAVGTTYYSTPVPKWFTIVVRTTGATWQFNGTSLVQIDSPAELSTRLDAVELTVTSLGTAAFEDIEFFATQAELDVAEADAAAYTDQSIAIAKTFSTFKQFGAIGNGVADDTTGVAAALSDVNTRTVDGGGLTYKINSNISITNDHLVIQNAVFDLTSLPSGVAFSFNGSESTGINLTADTLKGSNTLAVADTSIYTADDYLWLFSDTVFCVSPVVSLGQVVKIKSVDSPTSMTIYEDVLYDFTLAANAKIRILSLKKNIVLKNVHFIGANAGTQTAVSFNKCLNPRVEGCSFEYVDYVAVLFNRCVNSIISNSSMKYARTIGLAYGVVFVNGCYSGSVQNCYGEDLRHLVSVGDDEGINLFIRVIGNHAASSKDAGIDAHPACDFMIVEGNTVECVAGTTDAIIFQGLNWICNGNITVGNVSSSIRHQLVPALGSGSSNITNNRAVNSASTAASDVVINVTNDSTGAATLDCVSIANNSIDGAIENGIIVHARTGNIKNVVINGNIMSSIASVVACQLRASDSFSLEDYAITSNIFKCSGTQNIYLLGATVANVLNGVVSGNTIKGASNGIRTILADGMIESGNYNTGTVRKVFIDSGSSNINLDRRQSSLVTVTGATYTVLDQDKTLIANRAGTTTLTLPSASIHQGRELRVKTIQAQAVNSDSSNVIPISDSVAGTSILPATDGAWALLVSDGTNWNIMQRG